MIRKHAPPEHVSRLRYRIGLVLFCIPVVFAIVSPYLAHLVPPLETNGRVLAVVGDVLLLVSLFVLGGGFWDKLRALFVYEATTSFTQQVPDSD